MNFNDVVAAVLVLVRLQYERQGVRRHEKLVPALPPVLGQANVVDGGVIVGIVIETDMLRVFVTLATAAERAFGRR